MDQQPATVEYLKQTLIELGLWRGASSSSSDPAASDDSGAAADRPTSSEERRPTSTSSPGEASPCDDAWGGDSDDSGKAQVERAKRSGGSVTATGGSGGVAESSGSSGGRATSSSAGPLEDGDSTDTSAKRKGQQASDSTELAAAGSPAEVWQYNEAEGQAASCDDWAKAKDDECSDSAAKVKGSKVADHSRKRPAPALQDGMDCLPTDAVVWVEGKDVLKEISLAKGSRVLCFDSLTRSVRYAEVTDVRQDEESVQWVAVELSDGTRTILTADHPVQDSGKAQARHAERLEGSLAATRSSGGAAESSASSAGRAAPSTGGPPEDRDGRGTSAKRKGQQAAHSTDMAAAGGLAEAWQYNEAEGQASSSCDGSNDSAKAKDDECSDSSATMKDGENSDDSGKQLTPALPVHSMDCLPTDAIVWVEGEDVPKEISSLTRGSRVLCFDSLSRSVRYAEVSDVRQDQESVQWVAVELADGTKTILTADHPVQLAGNLALQSVVKARDIEPQKSQIMVHRVTTAPVGVRSVVALPPGLVLPSGRVSVAVQQPDRNAILVASPEQGHADARFVAVGSADLAPQPFGMLEAFRRSAKLLVSPGDVSQRSHSWPPSVGSRPVSRVLPLPVSNECMLKLASPHTCSSSSGTFRDSSTVSESGSETTSSGGDTLVMLPWDLPGKPTFAAVQGAAGTYLGRISALLQARAQSLPSVGSGGHATGTCKPCSFVRRGKCVGGFWCPHCHGEHRKCNGKLFAAAEPPRRGAAASAAASAACRAGPSQAQG